MIQKSLDSWSRRREGAIVIEVGDDAVNHPLKWRKDLRTGVRTAWFADGEKGRYQIIRVAEGSWVLHLPDGGKVASSKLRLAKQLASSHDAFGLTL